MRLNKYISIIILLFCFLCSCAKGGSNLGIKTSSPDKTLAELSSKTYDESQLSEIIKCTGSINELDAQYPIECLRKTEGTYRAAFLGDGRIAVILFDESGNRILGNIYSALQKKSDFSCLAKGQSLEDVKKVDPNGEYLFRYSGRDDTPKVSTHYTKDGYLIVIQYDSSDIIVNIAEELI